MQKAGFGLIAVLIVTLVTAGSAVAQEKKKKPDFPPFDEVAKDYTKVVSTVDGKPSLYTIWVDKKRNQMLAELPRGYGSQKHFVAVTQSSGGIFAGLQGPAKYVYWKRYDKRLALLEPELATRSTGEAESKASVKRLFTDRVLIDVPIVAIGPSGQPVIDMDDLLVKQGTKLLGGGRFGGGGGAPNSRLQKIAKAKAFPQNVELAFEVPMGGRLTTYHYSISKITKDPSYKPRMADTRVGYFTTDYRDLGKYHPDEKWVRYIDRWHLQKSDPKLKVSPPKEPIVYYLEHTIPIRYRRWVRNGVLHWNEAFRNVGLDNAIEVRFQDKTTGAHMEKDPEDVRYNFIRWLNNDISTAIGPHRSNPETGQILDADVVLTDGWIRAYWSWHQQMPELAVQSLTPETLVWLEDHPDWDPRLLLASPLERERMLAEREGRTLKDVVSLPDDPILREHQELAAIGDWLGHEHHQCLAAHGMAFDMAVARVYFDVLDTVEFAGASAAGMDDTLDGIPEWFIGPLLAELACHEVGHTLGLRHNFKSSSLYTLEEINSEEFKGKKPLAGSVMDYLPANFNLETGEIQGDFTMIAVGPYDIWAIEYGYTFDDPKEIAKRSAEPELAYLTDDDASGSDPLARRYDFGADPLDFAENHIRLAEYHRGRILDELVKDGQSWSKAREGYNMTLSIQTRMLSMMANWIGGAHVHRDHKGDPDARAPIEVADVEQQRAALQFVIDHTFNDEIFGLSPELLQHMTVDKWNSRDDSAYPVHDRVMGVQASVLTMVLNPTTLSRVHDNEFRTPTDEDALTLPEVMRTLVDAIYTELEDELDGQTFTDREPMITSLRRNLQSSMTDRLITLSADSRRMPRSVRTLSMHHLRELNGRMESIIEADSGQLDAYTQAHLEDLNQRIAKALNSIYVTPM